MFISEEFRRYLQEAVRYQMRWMYRYMGKPIPQFYWEDSDAAIKKLNAAMDREERQRNDTSI